MADPTKRIPKTKPKTPSERIPKKKPKTVEAVKRETGNKFARTPPKLTKTMIRQGLRREFVDTDNPISVSEGMTLGKAINYFAGIINPEFKKQVEAAKKAKPKAKAEANTISKKKGGKVKKRK